MPPIEAREPSLWRWVLKVAAAAGLTGIICCVAPAVLFLLGLAGGVWAISFADEHAVLRIALVVVVLRPVRPTAHDPLQTRPLREVRV